MVSRKTITMATLLAILSVALVAPAAMLSAEAIGVEIDVAPGTLNLSYNGQWVTVHTDLAYTLGEGLDWYLNDVLAEDEDVFSDDCGNLVAKFDVQAFTVPDVVKLGNQQMVLEGRDGETVVYSGSSTIRVINVGKR